MKFLIQLSSLFLASIVVSADVIDSSFLTVGTIDEDCFAKCIFYTCSEGCMDLAGDGDSGDSKFFSCLDGCNRRYGESCKTKCTEQLLD